MKDLIAILAFSPASRCGHCDDGDVDDDDDDG